MRKCEFVEKRTIEHRGKSVVRGVSEFHVRAIQSVQDGKRISHGSQVWLRLWRGGERKSPHLTITKLNSTSQTERPRQRHRIDVITMPVVWESVCDHCPQSPFVASGPLGPFLKLSSTPPFPPCPHEKYQLRMSRNLLSKRCTGTNSYSDTVKRVTIKLQKNLLVQ